MAINENQKRLRVKLKPAAAKWLRKCEPRIRKRIESALYKLEEDPIPIGARRLVGESSFRIRLGDYRIVYELQEHQLLVLVVKLGHRREVYRNF